MIDADVVSDHTTGDVAEERGAEVRPKEIVELQLLHFAIGERRPFIALPVDEIVVAPRLGIALEEEPRIGDPPEHDGVGTLTERAEELVGDDLAEPRVAFLAVGGDGALDLVRAQRA
jgi:hypothetical protein